jgi:hypothetical protein
MIKKLKIFAITMLATVATVTAARATVTYSATNVLQPVSIALTVYEQKPVSAPTAMVGSFKTRDLITAVESALGTNGSPFGNRSELAILTSNILVQIGVTTVTNTNASGNITNTLVLSSNTVTIGRQTITNAGTNGAPSFTNSGSTNLTIGDTGGNYYVTVTATNGSSNVLATTTTLGIGGLVATTTTNSATNLTLDADQTLAIGTNAAVDTETNLALGGTVLAVDTGTVVVFTNGVPIATNVIGTNTLTISTNSADGTNTVTVTLSTNSTIYTNTDSITNSVDIIGASSTNVIVATNGTAPGLGISASLSDDTLTTTFNLITNTTVLTNGSGTATNTTTTTNVAIVTTTTDYTTTGVVVSNVPVYATNTVTELVIADGAVNTPVPTNTLLITQRNTNDIISEGIADSTQVTTSWSTKILLLNTTNVFTNALDKVRFRLQGLVNETYQDFAVGQNKVAVTNEAWTDVSGDGFINGTAVVVGGTVTIGTPAIQKIPTAQ